MMVIEPHGYKLEVFGSSAQYTATEECLAKILGVRTNIPVEKIFSFGIGGSGNLMLDRLSCRKKSFFSGSVEDAKNTHPDSSFLLLAFPILVCPNTATLRFGALDTEEPWAQLICEELGPGPLGIGPEQETIASSMRFF